MTATWKCLISSLADNINKAQQNFTSLYEIGYGPLEFNMGLPTLHKVGRNNWDEDRKSKNSWQARTKAAVISVSKSVRAVTCF